LSAAGRLKDNSLIVRFGKKGLKKNQGTTYCFFISEAERLTGFLKCIALSANGSGIKSFLLSFHRCLPPGNAALFPASIFISGNQLGSENLEGHC
jgi:hypothetical protein